MFNSLPPNRTPPPIQVKDEAFDKEEKLFRSLEKAVRLLVKNVCCYLHHVQVRPQTPTWLIE